eukprot:GHVS01107895.1.p1 GENE.GHVS01107895.1~~GHVS01107895.1.p1  ORF type:complete len:463 (-),score=49.28 GHVS01107895.1:159-1547(-)
MKRLDVVLNQLQDAPISQQTNTTSTNNTNSLSVLSSPYQQHLSLPPRSIPLHQPSIVGGVFICSALRTPLTRSGRGLLRHLQPEQLLVPLFEATLKQTKIVREGGSGGHCLQGSSIEDICIGNVLQPGAGMLSSRIASLLSGLPVSTPVYTVNRLCSSGLQAVANIAAAIESGYIDIGIGGGVESMSQYDMLEIMNPEKLTDDVFDHVDARNCLLPMGVTSENVAAQFGITRQQQDQMAFDSQRKALRAQQNGNFTEEIVPIKVKMPKGEGEEDKVEVVTMDDGIRSETTLEGLRKLKPAFQKTNGTTTAGNSSQVTDGAAMVLLVSSKKIKELQIQPLARFISFAVVGVPPDIMGIGPAIAIPKVLKQTNLKISDIDIFEINEAFASQATYCVKQLNIPQHKLNPNGGAIALGHPLGCTGSRLIATLLPEMRRRNVRYGVVSMCIGTGMGAAAVIENLIFS